MASVALEDVIAVPIEHLRPVFDSSPDGVCFWLDEEHRRRTGHTIAYHFVPEVGD
jgi:hypothetical protein